MPQEYSRASSQRAFSLSKDISSTAPVHLSIFMITGMGPAFPPQILIAAEHSQMIWRLCTISGCAGDAHPVLVVFDLEHGEEIFGQGCELLLHR
jgi:hypothetical protein